jgi:hypothetical protein
MTDHHPFDGRHCYALIDGRDNIVRVTEPLDKPPENVPFHLWQQVVDDGAHFNPDLHERHSPKIVMRNDRRVYREFQIRRKA